MNTPNPGSPEAIKQGCLCPVIDNAHGKGYLGGVKDPETGETVFVWRADCPLHGISPNAARIEALARSIKTPPVAPRARFG